MLGLRAPLARLPPNRTLSRAHAGRVTRPDPGDPVSPVPSSVLDLIGNTPLVHLARLHEGPGRVLGKVEYLHPGGSVKDRAARAMIESAYARGALVRGQPVVEMTSGNMGAGLAVVCAVTGNPFTAVVSAGHSAERVRMLRALGAEVIQVPQVDGLPGRITGADIAAAARHARALARERAAYYVDQFGDPAGALAHERTTGPEIWRDAAGAVDAFVSVVGTGATFVGVSRFLKSRDARVRCLTVEPAGARVLAGLPVDEPKHVLQGAGYGSVPPGWDATLADGHLAVTDDEARRWRALLAEHEGIYVGHTAAANVCAASGLLRSGALPRGATVVTILCDTGLKYA